MNVHLFAVTGGSLEANALGPSVNQDGAIDLPAVFSLCQHIQQSYLSVHFQKLYSEVTYVVFPAPELPMRATKFPGFTKPKTLSNSCFFSP